MATTVPTPNTEGVEVSGDAVVVSATLEGKREKADQLIRKYSLIGTATGLIPVVGVDVAALTAVQTKMIHDIADVYGYDLDDNLLQTVLTTGATTVASRLLTGVASSLANSFSPLKALLGGATQAAIAGFMTLETGKLYQMHMEQGNDPADLGIMDVVNHVASQVQQGELNPNKMSLTSQLGSLLRSNQN